MAACCNSLFSDFVSQFILPIPYPVIGEFDLVVILMLLYGSVFDGAVTGVDFPLFSKKPCQVNFLKNQN